MHWDGSQWNVVSNPGSFGSYLHGVVAISSSDVWAVGEYNYPSSRSLTLHWNGNQWTQVSSPNPPGTLNILNGVTAISSTDIWAVGFSNAGGGVFHTLTIHWNGSQWRLVPSPDVSSANDLQGLSAIFTNDVWAIGNYQRYPYFAPLILHWDGSQWSVVPGPDVGTQSLIKFYGVKAVAPNDIWGVGNLVIHWNGSAWSIASSGHGQYDPIYVV